MKILQLLALVATLSFGGQVSMAQNSSQAIGRDIRFVVFHSPGPSWQPNKTLFEQVGVSEHVEHYKKLLGSGKLEFGGPHLDSKGGGMMIPVAGVTEQEVKDFASEDPAVKSGLLLAEVRPWLIGMKR